MPQHSNQLIHETSPYLLQHAHNPVDWHPWGEKALARAQEENKPILVSIGYAACHWCHVMERESFENEEVAAFMNEHFVNIKIDREERPDLDHIYMDAVQAMSGGGGWPLNVFLTPDAKPFYGGTYYPPKKMFNRPSWMDVLHGVDHAFREKRTEIDTQAENLTDHLRQSNVFGLNQPTENFISTERTKEIADNILKNADREWGGFGNAPKFPQTFSIQYLLRYSFLNPLPPGEKDESREQALLSLDKMIAGGLYDQFGGGFARYSTDTQWLAPHFEKMLYDNALLLSVISEAWQITRKKRYREVIDETMEFIRREMLHPDQGFYAALDADSEGVEGKFYVWDYNEVISLLGEKADIFCEYYDITKAGNWSEGVGDEAVNIPRVKMPLEEFSKEKNIPPDQLEEILENGRKKLMEKRKERIRPLLDDKIILGWNALMNTAISKVYAATGNEAYRALAIGNMQFLLRHFKSDTKAGLHHTWKNNEAKYPGFLDDYAFLIEALIHLQEITGDRNWLDEAATLTGYVIDNFSEEETGFFYYTPKDQKDVIIRKKEVFDSAVPSGNSVMSYNLHRLSILLDRPEWAEHSSRMVGSLEKAIISYPTSFGNWANLVLEKLQGTNEIVIVGSESQSVHKQVLDLYLPHRVLMAASKSDDKYPLLRSKTPGSATYIWLCRNYTCNPPVKALSELISLINRAPKGE